MTKYRVVGEVGAEDSPVTVMTEWVESRGKATGYEIGCEKGRGWRNTRIEERDTDA